MTKASLPGQPAPSGSPYSDDPASESLTSSLIKSFPTHEDTAADVESPDRGAPPQTHHPEPVPDYKSLPGGAGSGHNQLNVQVQVPSAGQGGPQAGASWFQKLKDRNELPAKFPAPVDQLFTQLEVSKLWFTIAVGVVTVLAGNQRYGVISEAFMEDLLIVTTLALLLLTAANILQKLVPEVAVVALLLGVSMAVLSAHALILSALPQNKRFLVIYPVFPGYLSLFLVIVYKIFKEDVRAPPDRPYIYIYARQDSTTSESSSYLASCALIRLLQPLHPWRL